MPDAALEVRMLDRFFDNYVSTPQQRPVFDALRPEADRDPYGVREALDEARPYRSYFPLGAPDRD